MRYERPGHNKVVEKAFELAQTCIEYGFNLQEVFPMLYDAFNEAHDRAKEMNTHYYNEIKQGRLA
jgi:hypothetical protein